MRTFTVAAGDEQIKTLDRNINKYVAKQFDHISVFDTLLSKCIFTK